MPPTNQKEIFELFINLFLTYGLPALALCAVLTYISAKIGKKGNDDDSKK